MSTALAVQHETQHGAVMNAPARGALLRPIAPMKEIIEAKNELDELIQKALKPDVDFGVVPGSDRQVLFKAGAERVAGWHGCYFRYEIIEKEINHDVMVPWRKRFKLKYENKALGKKKGDWHEIEGTSLGLYRYVVRASLVHRASGEVVGDGIGICSTLESKYIDRPRDLENTVVKMAQKRGAVAAALNAFALSDRFTQDIEDMPHDGDDEEVTTGETQQQQRQQSGGAKVKESVLVDERGVALLPFGPEAVRWKPIDDVGAISLELLTSAREWVAKDDEKRERFSALYEQIVSEMTRRVREKLTDDKDMSKTIGWILKQPERRETYDAFIRAAEERMESERQDALDKQKSDAAHEIEQRADAPERGIGGAEVVQQ